MEKVQSILDVIVTEFNNDLDPQDFASNNFQELLRHLLYQKVIQPVYFMSTNAEELILQPLKLANEFCQKHSNNLFDQFLQEVNSYFDDMELEADSTDTIELWDNFFERLAKTGLDCIFKETKRKINGEKWIFYRIEQKKQQ